MIYSRIDLHKTNMVITTIDSNGVLQAREKLACLKPAVTDYFGRFTQPHRAVVESIGSWYWLSDLLGEIGIELILAHALQVKAISYAKVKTDVVDSGMLAELLRAGLIPQAHQISPGSRELREVMRARLRLVGGGPLRGYSCTVWRRKPDGNSMGRSSRNWILSKSSWKRY